MKLPRAASTLAKDIRWYLENRRYVVEDLLAAIEGTQPVLVWQHHDLFLDAGTRLAKRLEVPIVQFVDALIVWEARRWGVQRQLTGNRLERWAELPALLAADIVACVSAEVAERVVDAGVDSNRVVVTPCTAEIEDFQVPESAGLRFRSDIGIGDRPVIGWLGSFRRFHALDVLVDAWPRVLESHPEACLLLIGDGPEHQAVLARLAALGVDGSVVAPGAIPHEQVPEALSAMDIAVLTARPDQEFHYSPLKLREYLAAGKALVVPQIGEPGRLIQHGVTGQLYPPGDSEKLAKEISALLATPVDAEAVAFAGQEMHRKTGQIDGQLEDVASRLGLG